MKNRQTKTTCYHYTAHRLDSVSYDDALSTVYHYNAYGQPDSVYDESGVMCYEYGNMGEVTKETRIYALPLLSQPIALSTLFEYDSWGRILNITYPDNEIVNYDYDLGGQLFRMYNNSSYTYLDNIIYDCFGAKTSQDYGNGIVTQYTYNDTTRRLSEIATNNGALINYTYDLVGNVTQVSSICPWLQNQSFTENFTYDSTDQLTVAQESQNNGYQLAVNYGNWGKIMQYDIAQTDMLSNATETHSRSYSYPVANYSHAQTSFAPIMQTGDEQISLSYGINGSLRQREVQTPNPHTEYFLFNSQANLKAYSDDIMDFAYYGYNAANTRTYKISLYNTNLWINGQQQPLNLQWQNAMFYPNTYLNFNQNGEYTKHYYNGMERIASKLGDNTITIAINSDNTLEDRKLLLEEHFREDIHKLIEETIPIDMPPFIDVNTLQPTGTPNDIYYYHPNHLGSTAFVTDNNATITQGFLYAPFGEITTEYNINFGNNVIPKYSFNAKELDEETGMYYYEARYYAPPVFTSRDPLFEKYFWMTPYAYCANNPVKYVDPSGEYYIKPPSKKNNTYRVQVTNFNWVNKVSMTTAVPCLGILYEGMLIYQRCKDPSFDATTLDYFGLGFQLSGAGFVKFLAKFGKIDGFGQFLLNANRKMVTSLMSAFSNPETSEIALEYMTVRVLENEGKGIVISNSLNNVREYSFSFKKSITDKIEKEILSDKNLTSQKDFNLEKEVTKRLEIMINNKKEEIRKSLAEE